MEPEMLELATTPRAAGYIAIIIENNNDESIIEEDVWQEWIREDRLL